MPSVACANPECPRHDTPVPNSTDLPIEEIRCGACGGPVEDVPTETAP